jgi:transaldolase
MHSCLLLLIGLVGKIQSFSPPLRGNGRLFLDTAVESEWDELLPTGLFHGITTNPTLLEKADQPCTVENLHRLATKAFTGSKGKGIPSVHEFMCQAWGATADDLYNIGIKLAEPDKERIVVKVPVTLTGVQAARRLIHHGVRVCLTACYHRQQAVIAAAIGAEYLAPYVGRMGDAGKDGVQECLEMNYIVDGMQAGTRILVASLRDAETLAELASSGMDTFTFGAEVARELFHVPLTREAAKDFEEAAKRGSKR